MQLTKCTNKCAYFVVWQALAKALQQQVFLFNCFLKILKRYSVIAIHILQAFRCTSKCLHLHVFTVHELTSYLHFGGH